MSLNTLNRGCLVALSLFTIVDNIEIDIRAVNKIQQPDAEPILADVMRNITRVNTMLQDLIKNYEKLEKISKAHSVESDSTDTEVEELFNSERNKRNKDTKSTTAAETHKAYATAMFYEERDLNPDSKSENQDTNSSSDSAEAKQDEPANTKVKELKKENEHEDKNEDTKGIRTVEKQADTKNNASEVENKADESFVPALKELKNLIKDLSDRSASVDSGEINDKNESFTTTNARILPNKAVLPGSLLNLGSQLLPKVEKLLEPRLEHNDMPEIIRRARKNNADETILIGTPEKHQTEKKENSNATNYIESKSKKMEPKWSQSETESSEEIKIQNEELKTSVLRQAYGDACLRLVACKSVLKDVCNRRKRCPSDIRDAFKGHAVRGCKNVFHNHNHSIDFRMYTGKNEDDGSEDFNDLTRVGYLSMACFPEKRRPANETVAKPNVTIDPKVKSMNILRDRYEAACQEESMRKCYKACTGAAKQTCAGDKCSERRLKEFGTACKTRCKQNYGIRDKKKSDDSDSDTSSDSDDSDKSSSKGGGNSW
ncbi:hypothetical protein MSG28_015737 [Choristoneura fumiferana]|uniref:Uncharacterized protein n=1 Tax=Choristoneura fumiferana TaxID=7141 RepID=A0ACC0KBB7_CHOFU|nr:hypothetical protein MSG28_015737 [Choristoneura fumiferana]